MINKKMVVLNNARKKEQIDKMKKIMAEDICPFCPKYLTKYHDFPIERTGKFWSVTKNDYPYDGTAIHYLFIYKKHIENISQISTPAFGELLTHLKWLIKKYKLPAGGFAMRFGDPDYTQASVTHLHAHLIVGEKITTNNKNKYLNFPIGYQK